MNDSYLRVLTLLDLPFDPEQGAETVSDGEAGGADSNGSQSARQAPVNPGSAALKTLTVPEYFSARKEHSGAAFRQARVDDVTGELVRLRNAQRQKCEFCMNIRSAAVFSSDADSNDAMETVRMYESSDLPEHQKVALRLADAFLAYPRGFGADQRAEVLAHYDSEQIVELLLKLMCWSQNRTPIALGMDGAIDADKLTAFEYDTSGNFVFLVEAAGATARS
jgi:alkylhydroperoxidase family enzyme